MLHAAACVRVAAAAQHAWRPHVHRVLLPGRCSFKGQLDGYVASHVAANSAESDEALAALERLSRAQALVESLGLEARTRPPGC